MRSKKRAIARSSCGRRCRNRWVERFRIAFARKVLEVDILCDVTKYSKMYQDMIALQPEDTLQLVMEAKDEDERNFFEMVGNFLLKQKQKKVIEDNLF